MSASSKAVTAIFAIVALAAETEAQAADDFIDTRALRRHAGQELPVVPGLAEVMLAPSAFPYRRLSVPAYSPSADEVAGLPARQAAMAGYSGPGNTALGAVSATRASADGVASAALRTETAHAFRDGGGTRIDYGYERDTEYLFTRAGKPAEGTVSLFGLRDVFEKAKVPNYGVDVPRLEQALVRMDAGKAGLPGVFDSAAVMASWGHIHIDTDNFSLRTPGTLRLAHLQDVREWRTEGTLARSEGTIRTGLAADLSYQTHANTLYNRHEGPEVVGSYRIPGTEAVRAGLTLDHRREVEGTTVRGALRWDVVARSAEDAHTVPNGSAAYSFDASPQQLWDRYYGGDRDNDVLEQNLSGRIRAERPIAGVLVHGDLRRMVRSPDNGERYYANSGPSGLVQVGNPQIEPEKHHVAEIGAATDGGGWAGYGKASPAGAWAVSATLAHDHVEDFITPDRARGQPGILMSDSAIIYRNVGVEMSTAALDVKRMLGAGSALRLNVTAARGRNTTDGRPLYQVAPLEANAFLDLFGGDPQWGWNAGMRLRAVAAKHSVDDSTTTGIGQDASGPSAGFATLDLYAGWQVERRLAITAGIDNVFDKLYHEHIAAMPQTPTTSSINAPGRTFHVRAVTNF